MIKPHVNVIGAGFAGIECALYLAERGVRVHMFNVPHTHYVCERMGCCDSGLSAKDIMARDALRQELHAEGSQLICEEERLNKIYKNVCNAEKIINIGIEKLKKHENIDYFELCVHEINLKEINVIASGRRTEGRLYEWLQKEFGSARCHDTFASAPLVKNVDENEFVKIDGRTYLPLNYQQYISFCNKIIEERNQHIDYLKSVTNSRECIEEIVLKYKDALKDYVMKPVAASPRPYAAIEIEKHEEWLKLLGLASALPTFSQLKIIRTLKGFEDAILIRSARTLKSCYIDAPTLINEFGQSRKWENLFFAGNISGLLGHDEGMASGIYVAKNVLNYINGKNMSKVVDDSLIYSLMKKLLSQNVLKFTPIMANYDILLSNNKSEELKNGRNV